MKSEYYFLPSTLVVIGFGFLQRL